MKTVLIHPGFHKTGTTYLQMGLFADEKQFRQPWSRGFIEAHLIRPHQLHFDPLKASEQFQDMARTTSNDVIDILSEEDLGGNPYHGAREAAITATKLRAVFNNAKILFTVRRQSEMIRSLYIQYLKEGGKLSAEEFFSPQSYRLFFAFDKDIFSYHYLINHYAALFGKDNILVLPQEYLQRDEAGFVADLGQFLGRRLQPAHAKDEDKARHASPPESSIPFLRLGNHFYTGPFNEPGFINAPYLGKAFRSLGYRQRLAFKNEGETLKALIKAKFSGYYAASNAELQSFVPVSLKTYQYELPQ